ARLDLLIIDKLELLPEYRGKGLGEKIISHIIKRFLGGAGLVAIKPLSSKFDDPAETDQKEWWCLMNYKEFSRNIDVSKDKLYNYFESLGFEKIDHTGVMTMR
ncbi:MAG: GNAT family N-acetyltransferase, partial [Thermotogota bacterium]|nr:GNAT family N-acetyltransferase [Thermotogota bacterium]